MTEKPSLTRLLKTSAGVGEQAALVYKYILIVGSLTIGEICEYTGLSFEVSSKLLGELIDKKLIRKLTHVVDRYVAVAPYRAFAESLVEFQRAMKELEEKAARSIDSALADVSKTNEEWKASAIKLREEQVAQAKRDTQLLREEATLARKNLVEKMRHETEAKKSSLTDMLKKHVNEYTARISEVEKDISLNIDNSIAKFAETSSKLKEQVSQTGTSYLRKFGEGIETFHGAIDDDLASFQSMFSSSVEGFQGQTYTFVDDSIAKIHELIDTMKNKTNDLIYSVEESFAQLSTKLLGTVSTNVDSAIGAVTVTNKDLEVNLTGSTRTYSEKLNGVISNFQSKTQETIDGWRSSAENEMQIKLKTLGEEMSSQVDFLAQQIESTKGIMSELSKSHLSSVEIASSDLSSNLSSLTTSLKEDLTSKSRSLGEELEESIEDTSKECNSLVLTLEGLSKKSIPLTSKTITDFTSDVDIKLAKMTNNLVANAKSFSSEIKEKSLETIDTLASVQARPSAAEAGKKSDETQIKGGTLKKELGKRIEEISSTYVNEMKKSIEAVDKYATERISATLGFEKDLEKKWDTITGALSKVTALSGEMKSFPQRISKNMNDLIDQYYKKAEGTVASAKRLLSVHSTTLRDAINNSTKKWSTAVERSKKEFTDLSSRSKNALIGIYSKQIGTIDKVTSEQAKTLADLATRELEAIKSGSLAAQAGVSEHVGKSIEDCRVPLADVEEKLKSSLQAGRESFKMEVGLRSKESEQLSAELIKRGNEAAASLKEALATVINGGKEQARQVCQSTSSRLGETMSAQSKELQEIVLSVEKSFGEMVDAVSESYRKEGESIKDVVTAVLSQHLRDYAESVRSANTEIDTTFTKHFEDCNELTGNFGQKLDELLVTHEDKYERVSIEMTEGLTNCIDRDEATISEVSKRMLNEFTDNTTKANSEAGSTENLLRTAWAEIVDTEQISADKTWHYVTKQAILHHMKDMVRRTKSTVTIVVPNLEEAPLREVKEISKAIRINIIAGIDEVQHKKLLKELFEQGNIRLWSLTEKDYISCTRDAEEVLIAPAARRDTDCVATVSTEENYVKLYHKFIGPMWMASSRELKEKTLR